MSGVAGTEKIKTCELLRGHMTDRTILGDEVWWNCEDDIPVAAGSGRVEREETETATGRSIVMFKL